MEVIVTAWESSTPYGALKSMQMVVCKKIKRQEKQKLLKIKVV
ncbi:hypothetical protein VCRA2128O305_370025 [Vibrio crassostreae]|nr:hypothetical protein VCRA2112O187_140047 [Vibrio crassostreae]CAK1925004.1 hypothetical protein VCRA2112O185_220047 [Vibrio crassostreae]CAK1925103.1 hypothetical protein VCRA2112E186_230048 [Vibrio crassostreae]CAK1931651.1 hypothetical protein VCRA2118O239_240025 [Vibrio crassostreae]CAK1936207.1 hypothetical protein VCRA2119O245_260048 [Vibrio crassostreae]